MEERTTTEDDLFESGLSDISEFVCNRMIDGSQLSEALDDLDGEFSDSEVETYRDAAAEILGYMMSKGKDVSLSDFYTAVDKRVVQLSAAE